MSRDGIAGARTGAAAARPEAILAMATVAASLVAVWLPAFPPGQDAAQHLLAAQMMATPERFEAWFEIGFPLTGQLFTVVTAGLAHALPLLLAAKTCLTLIVAAVAIGCAVVAYRVDGDVAVAAAVGAAFSVGWLFAMGFYSFLFGVGLGISALAAWLAEPGLRRTVSTLALLLLASVAHVIAGAMFAGLIIGVTLLSERNRRAFAELALAVVPPVAMGVAFAVRALQAREESGAVAGTGTQRGALGQLADELFLAGFGGLSWVGALLSAALLIGLLVALLRAWEVRNESGRADGRQTRRLSLLLLALATLLLFLVIPLHALGWHYARPRLLCVVMLLPAAAVTWSRRPWAGPGIAALALASAVASVVAGASVGTALERQVDGFGDGPVGRAMTVVVDPREDLVVGPYTKPALHVTSYALLEGGAAPYVFAGNPVIHAVSLRDEVTFPPAPPQFLYESLDCDRVENCVEAARAMPDRLAVQGLPFDTVLLAGAPDALRSHLTMRGYERVAENRYRPRPSRLLVDLLVPAWAEGNRIVVRAGYPSTFGWFAGAIRPAGPLPVDGREGVAVGPIPAGIIYVQAFADPDGNGQPDDPDAFVGGSDLIRVAVEPGTDIPVSYP